jgi:hypothetical protein
VTENTAECKPKQRRHSGRPILGLLEDLENNLRLLKVRRHGNGRASVVNELKIHRVVVVVVVVVVLVAVVVVVSLAAAGAAVVVVVVVVVTLLILLLLLIVAAAAVVVVVIVVLVVVVVVSASFTSQALPSCSASVSDASSFRF